MLNRVLRILAATLVAITAAAAPIEQYHLEADGKDWAPAFERAEQQCPGCTIELQPVTYPLARTVNVCWPLQVRGQGLPFSLIGTRITTTRQTAFQTWSKKERCPITGGMSQDGELELEHVSILQTGGLSKTGEVPFHGVAGHRRVLLYDVGIRGFVHGVDLVCDAVAYGTICSVSRFIAVDVDLSEHAGFYFQGGDSSAHSIVSPRADGNCRQAAQWNAKYIAPLCAKKPTHPACTDQHLQCAGIMDLSFFGSSYLGAELATERQISPQVDYAGMVLAGDNNFSAAVGTYTETNTGYQWADGKVTVLGGAETFAGAAGQLHGMNAPGFVIKGGAYTFKLGQATNLATSVWTLGNEVTSSWPWGFNLDKTTGAMTWDIGHGPLIGATLWRKP
jgi:hypothetical protein